MAKFNINKCSCGRQATLRKAHYQSTQNIWVEKTEFLPTTEGGYELVTYQVKKEVPTVGTKHYVQCPNIDCRRHTSQHSTKTRAVNAWNNFESTRTYNY